MWTKIEMPKTGRSARKKFGVFRNATNCFLLIPATDGFKAGGAVEYFATDGKIGFAPSGEGYSLCKYSKNSTSLRVCIPTSVQKPFPIGTTDIEVTRDGDMYVIDLAQFSSQKATQ